MTTTTTRVKSRDGIDAESMKRDLLVMFLRYEDPDIAVEIALELMFELTKSVGAPDFWDDVRERLGCILREDGGYDCIEDEILDMDIDDDDWLEDEEF